MPRMEKDPFSPMLERTSVLSDVIVPKDFKALLLNSLPLMSKISNFFKLDNLLNPVKYSNLILIKSM